MEKNYKNKIKYGVLLLVLFISIGYAAISTTLTINGTATAKTNSWEVKFDTIQIDENSVEATTEPTISDDTDITYEVELSNPGDEYTFTVDVVNSGSIDAMINSVTPSTLTTDEAKYLDLSITYSDDTEISQYDKLAAGATETIKISLKYKDDIDSADLPSTDEPVTVSLSLEYAQADDNAVDR